MRRNSLKRIVVRGLQVVLILSFMCGCAVQRPVPTHPSQLSYPELEMKNPKPRVDRLTNGMKVFSMEEHSLPLIHIRAVIRTGSIYEAKEKLGLASFCGSVIRSGGTKNMTGDEIDDNLEFMAAGIESSISQEMGVLGLTCHSKDLEKCLGIFADIMMNPAFDEKKMEIQRGKMKDAIRRQNDDPSGIADREFSLAVYGKESPWARVPTLESVDLITKEDLIDWHDRFYHPSNVMLGAAGDFDTEKLNSLLEKVFAGWEEKEVTIPPVPPVDRSVSPRVVYIPKELEQTTIRMGHFGYNRQSPDRFPIEVLNYIYGIGGFSCRLMSEVRSDRGLAYSVWGYVGRGTDVGLFRIGCETKPESTVEAVRVMTRITQDVRDQLVKEDELRMAIDAMSNQFVFLYDSPQKIVDQTVDFTYYGYPGDFLDTYLKNLQAVTLEDVHQVALEYMHPDKMVILVVGDKTKFDGDISELGPVEVLKLEETATPQ